MGIDHEPVCGEDLELVEVPTTSPNDDAAESMYHAFQNCSELMLAMEEVELLIAYLSRNGKEPSFELLKSTLAQRNLYLQDGRLHSDIESEFWVNYRALVRAIYPATVSSIKETCPSGVWKERFPNTVRRVKRVPIYYGISVFLLILFTVSLQTYSMIGAGVLNKTFDLFNKRNAIQTELRQLKQIQGVDPSGNHIRQLIKFEREEQQLDQEFDANRTLLYKWNDVWQLGADEPVRFSSFDEYKYQHQAEVIKEKIEALEFEQTLQQNPQELTVVKLSLQENQQALHQLEINRKLNESRNLFFSERLSAVYVVNLLEHYILPLLFGCLGAFTLVLRTLHEAFKLGTFTLKNVLDYNIRIVLGGVTGISSGMFFSDTSMLPSGDFAPMLVAFVVGYNVEILFMLMDDIASRLSTRQKKEENKMKSSSHDNSSD
ncbi:hypothetical protein [Alteromonas sp. a30]|uniref:hypothetical protein n=1 Tax=Alteromonas sp. a30 TaxID=2730917 RepID=UPI002280A0A1|nr:hypothetical protein [Alteromonas sp. a30]MCY7295754.1 hypothetical protein [Alteromonas sp. a30]